MFRRIIFNTSKIFRVNSSRLSSLAFLDIDIEYYCNENNYNEIKNNIAKRKGIGDIDKVLHLYHNYKHTPVSDAAHDKIKKELSMELKKLPNRTHPTVQCYGNEPKLLHELNTRKEFKEKPLEFSQIAKRLNFMRSEQLGHTCGPKSYYFLGQLAELEEALIKYTVSKLVGKGFNLISVPDILPRNVFESCGMTVNSDRTQIYALDPIHHGTDLYLSGTSELSLAGLYMNAYLKQEDLPLKLAAVSRCYRAETSNVLDERGIYRVHQFTKVEMFVLSAPEKSDEMLEYLRERQEELFAPLGFHMQVLDMPPHELGAPAYRKYDIEAWMPGRNAFGEISSCSNCTDYQSRRLNIKYNEGPPVRFVHTLNGTACAVPRMLIAIVENNQAAKGKIWIPEVLQPYMNGKKFISKNTSIPELKLLKIKK